MIAALPAITEADFLRQVMELARLFGWAVYHPQLSKWSERGFPDLSRCEGVESCLWRPDDFDAVARILQ